MNEFIWVDAHDADIPEHSIQTMNILFTTEPNASIPPSFLFQERIKTPLPWSRTLPETAPNQSNLTLILKLSLGCVGFGPLHVSYLKYVPDSLYDFGCSVVEEQDSL